MNHTEAARLQRSLSALTIGLVHGQRRLRAELAPLEPGEMMQCVQVPVSGKAGSLAATQTVQIAFANPFLGRVAKAQTHAPFDNPMLLSGAEVHADGYVTVDVQVSSWVVDDGSFVTGANLLIATFSPGVTEQIPFRATVHAAFVGYASPTDESDW